jgi:hypothetical protein
MLYACSGLDMDKDKWCSGVMAAQAQFFSEVWASSFRLPPLLLVGQGTAVCLQPCTSRHSDVEYKPLEVKVIGLCFGQSTGNCTESLAQSTLIFSSLISPSKAMRVRHIVQNAIMSGYAATWHGLTRCSFAKSLLDGFQESNTSQSKL